MSLEKPRPLESKIYIRRLTKFFCFFLLIFSFLAIDEAMAQRKNYKLKRKNRKVSRYKGGSIHFDKNKRYLTGGIGLDALNYFGDLAPASEASSTDISFTKPGVSVFVAYRYTPNLTFRGQFSWGRLKGDDFKSADPYGDDSKFRYVRNLSFRNDIKELSFIGVWDIFGNHGTFLNRMHFTPYIFGGVGIFHHNPRAKVPELDRNGNPLDQAGEWYPLRKLGTEGQLSEHYDIKKYSVVQPSFPVGLGIRAELDKRWDFEFEIGYRFLLTDYIDDVSGQYVDLGALDNDFARTMSDRSRETTAVSTGENRDFEAINAITTTITYTSEFDGNDYTVFAGYGQPHIDSNRGFATQNDIYIVTSIRLSYVITGTFKRAKFR